MSLIGEKSLNINYVTSSEVCWTFLRQLYVVHRSVSRTAVQLVLGYFCSEKGLRKFYGAHKMALSNVFLLKKLVC